MAETKTASEILFNSFSLILSQQKSDKITQKSLFRCSKNPKKNHLSGKQKMKKIFEELIVSDVIVSICVWTCPLLPLAAFTIL